MVWEMCTFCEGVIDVDRYKGLACFCCAILFYFVYFKDFVLTFCVLVALQEGKVCFY